MTGLHSFYAAIGSVFTQFVADPSSQTLVRGTSLDLALNIQSARRHPNLPMLYVACSARVDREDLGQDHTLETLIVGEDDTLSRKSAPIRLPHRPIHITCSSDGRHLVVAFNRPAGVAVWSLRSDGTLGDMVVQDAGLDVGVFPHDVHVTPEGTQCIVVSRGNPGTRGWWSFRGPQKDPGSLNTFDFIGGALQRRRSVVVGDGLHFGPRNLAFHPSRPWVYVSLETQNDAMLFARDESGLLPTPLQCESLLRDPDGVLIYQGAGTVQVHPDGRAVYFVNRAAKPIPRRNGPAAMIGGENSFVVAAIDPESGRFTEVQRIDTGGISARTFALHPSGDMLVAANSEERWVRVGVEIVRQPANLTTFEVHENGCLERKHTYEVDLPSKGALFWVG